MSPPLPGSAVQGPRLGLEQAGWIVREESGSAVPTRDYYLVGSQWFQGYLPRAHIPFGKMGECQKLDGEWEFASGN